MEHAADSPASPDEDAPGVLRVMAVRAVLLGVSLSGVFMTGIAAANPHGFDRWVALGCTAAGLMGGASLSLGALCERRWHEPRCADALAAALGVTGVAFVATVLACFEIPYVIEMARTHSLAAALDGLRDGWRLLQREPETVLGLALTLSPIFGVTTFARTLRARGVKWLLIAALSPITSIPGLVIFDADKPEEPILAFAIAGCAVFVPLVAAAAGRLEDDGRGAE